MPPKRRRAQLAAAANAGANDGGAAPTSDPSSTNMTTLTRGLLCMCLLSGVTFAAWMSRNLPPAGGQALGKPTRQVAHFPLAQAVLELHRLEPRSEESRP